MKKATVTFIQYHTYEVEISDETYDKGNGWEAIEIAEKEFKYDMRTTVSTSYDDVEVEFIDEE